MTTYQTEAVSTKLCNVCKEVKSASEFYQTKKSRDGLLSRCKACHRAAVLERQKECPEITNAATRRWKRKHREQYNKAERRRLANQGREKRAVKYRRNDLWRLYEVTPQLYLSKWAEQGEACGICGAKESGAHNRRPAVDHNHSTGQNRGILCHACNVSLHILERIPDWPEKARAYLAFYARHDHGETRSTELGGEEDHVTRRSEPIR